MLKESIKNSMVNSLFGPVRAFLMAWLPKYDILDGQTGHHDMTTS